MVEAVTPGSILVEPRRGYRWLFGAIGACTLALAIAVPIRALVDQKWNWSLVGEDLGVALLAWMFFSIANRRVRLEAETFAIRWLRSRRYRCADFVAFRRLIRPAYRAGAVAEYWLVRKPGGGRDLRLLADMGDYDSRDTRRLRDWLEVHFQKVETPRVRRPLSRFFRVGERRGEPK
jgi:hypothetical protein